MNNPRKNEHGGRWFRSERVFAAEGLWYFGTREGVDLGPYETQREAQIEAGFLRELLMGQPEPTSAHETVRQFAAEARTFAAAPRARIA